MSEAEASKVGAEPAKNGTTVNGEANWRDWPTENATARAYGLVSAQLRRITKKHSLGPYRAPDLTLRYGPHVVAQLETILKKDGIPSDPDADDDDDEPRLRVSGKKAAESELIAALRLSQEHTRQSAKLYHEGMKEALDLMKAANKDLAEECRTLRTSHREATEAREAALDQRLERDMLIEQQRKKDARLDAVMTTAGQGIQMAIAQIVETWQDWKKPKNVKAAELLTKLARRIAETLELSPEEKEELLKVVVGEEEAKAAPEAKPAPAEPQPTRVVVVESQPFEQQASSSSSSDTAPKTEPTSTSMADESRPPAAATAASSGAGTDAGSAPTANAPAGTAAAGDHAGTAGPETKPRASRRAPSDTRRKKDK